MDCLGFMSLFSELRGLRDGDLPGAEAKNEILSEEFLQLHPRAIVGSAEDCRVDDYFIGFALNSDSFRDLGFWLRWLKAIRVSGNDGWESRGRLLVHSLWRSLNGDEWKDLFEEELSKASVPSYAVVVSAVVLLSLVYQYLTGNADLGSSKSYSRSSLDFRDIYVAVVLFLGAYVWIKFREVALRGAHKRTRVDQQGRTKVVYRARLTPPKWNGETVPKLELGEFAIEQEAHHKFLIAAFYYNRYRGLLDGWFKIPRRKGQRRLTGAQKRAWVKVQAKKVYEDFRKKEADLLVQEYLKDPMTPEQDEVNVDCSNPRLLNTDEHQQPALVSQVENLGMDMAMPDNQGWECASHSLGGVHEGLALSNGHSLGFQGGSALPVSLLPTNTESGMSLNGSDQWDLLQTRVSAQQQQIYLQQQQISDQQQQITLQHQQISDQQQQITIQHQQISDQQQQIALQHQQISDQQQQIAVQRRQIQKLGAQMSQFQNGDEDGAGAGAEQASPLLLKAYGSAP